MTAPLYPLLSDLGADAFEQALLARWHDERLFARVQDAHKDGTPFVFFEGPPTANGRPGIHHVFARTIKDLFCRHRAMQGHFVPRKAGWDTHGLPVEVEVFSPLGILVKKVLLPDSLEIDLFDLPTGNFLIVARSERQVWAQRLVKI